MVDVVHTTTFIILLETPKLIAPTSREVVNAVKVKKLNEG
jgi:hypothetical protein